MRKWTAVWLALILLLAAAPAPAEEAPASTAQPQQPMDGTLRVQLQSLGARTALGLTLEGAYAVDGDRGFQFAPGTEIAVGLNGGHILLRVGGATIDMGTAFALTRHISPDGSVGGAYIHESEKDTLYCGDIAFAAQADNILVTVTMGIEDYLYGVVPYEMSNAFPLEALKAQAVAARTYAMQRKARGRAEYDVADTANDQVFKGLDPQYDRAILAVDETRGLVGMYGDTYAECFYSASNGGQTALASDVWGPGDFGYLDIRDDPYDLENRYSVVKRATVPRDATKLTEPLYGLLVSQVGIALADKGEIADGEGVGLAEIVSVEATSPVYGGESRQYGTVRFTVKASVRRLIEGGDSLFTMLGEVETLEEPVTVDLSFYDEVRQALGVGINASKYDLFTVEEAEDGFTVINRRYGHGVGLSQRGAEQMAGEHGMRYLDILSFYYPGMALVQMDWQLPTLTAADALPDSLGYAAARPTATPIPTPSPSPAPLPALQAGEYYATVIATGPGTTLNVRSTPTVEDNLVGVLGHGARIIVEGEEAPEGWVKMKTVEMEGYVMISFIEREQTP